MKESIICLLCERHCDLSLPYCYDETDYDGYYDEAAVELREYAYGGYSYEMPEL